MAVLARDIWHTVGAAGSNHLRMKRMLEWCILVTDPAVDRLNLFLMRNVLRIESCVTRDADKFLVRRMIQDVDIHVEGDCLPTPFHRQRLITVTGETFLARLPPETRAEES
jgi:hypothetical protein